MRKSLSLNNILNIALTDGHLILNQNSSVFNADRGYMVALPIHSVMLDLADSHVMAKLSQGLQVMLSKATYGVKLSLTIDNGHLHLGLSEYYEDYYHSITLASKRGQKAIYDLFDNTSLMV